MKKHGHRTRVKRSKEYTAWVNMKDRCYNANSQYYSVYGGRGISVCDRWLNSFEAFLEDVGEAPGKEYSLDRYPDVNGNYEPENVRWATTTEQSFNRAYHRILTCNGQSKAITKWAKERAISLGTIYSRIERGWSVEAAIFTKPNKKPKV